MTTTRARATAAIVVGLLALGACGGDDDSNDDAAPVDTEETSPDETSTDETSPAETSGGGSGSTDDGSGGDGTASMMLSIDGGPASGTHNASAPDAGCSRNPTGDGTFGLQYSLVEQEGFHSFQIVIDDADAAATGNSAFSATAYVDDNRVHFDRGSEAMLTLEDEGNTATITLIGTTDDGVDVSATVECHRVVDL